MPRLKHKTTGVVVDVDDATAARLSADYTPVAERKQATATTRRTAKK